MVLSRKKQEALADIYKTVHQSATFSDGTVGKYAWPCYKIGTNCTLSCLHSLNLFCKEQSSTPSSRQPCFACAASGGQIERQLVQRLPARCGPACRWYAFGNAIDQVRGVQ